MTAGNTIIETMEYFDLGNKVQCILDFIGKEMDSVGENKERAIQNNEDILARELNEVFKSYYVIESILRNLREDNERMNDEIVMLVKKEQEKNALSQADQSEDNA